MARELILKKEGARLEDDYRQVIAQRELVFELKAADLTCQRILHTVPKEQLSNLVDLCKIYECLPEGLIEALVELEENTKELEEKLEI
jgi:ATP-dependent helicase/DNAse subunit B